MNGTTVTTPNELEIRVERVFGAPRAHVFSVWTDPELIPEWWGDGTVVEEMDVRPGGVWRFIMHGPDGTDYKNRIVFTEVSPQATRAFGVVSRAEPAAEVPATESSAAAEPTAPEPPAPDPPAQQPVGEPRSTSYGGSLELSVIE